MIEETNAVLAEQIRGLRRDVERFERDFTEYKAQREADDRWLRRIIVAALVTGLSGIAFSIFQNGLGGIGGAS